MRDRVRKERPAGISVVLIDPHFKSIIFAEELSYALEDPARMH